MSKKPHTSQGLSDSKSSEVGGVFRRLWWGFGEEGGDGGFRGEGGVRVLKNAWERQGIRMLSTW